MPHIKHLFYVVIISLAFATQAHASLKQSTKPASLSVYIEDNPPFSDINSQNQAQGLLVDYWNSWSDYSGIEVNFKLYRSSNIAQLLDKNKPAIFSSVGLNKESSKGLKRFVIMPLQADIFYLKESESKIKRFINNPNKGITVGGILPEAHHLPFINEKSRLSYKSYPGLLDLLIALYQGDIDGFLWVKHADAQPTLVDKFLPSLLSQSKVKLFENNFYAYSTLKQANTLAWAEWGSTHSDEFIELSIPMFAQVNASLWGLQEDTQRYFLIALSILLLIILIKRAKRKKDQQFKDILDSSPYPLVISSLDGKQIFYSNEEANLLFPFRKEKKHFVFEEGENQVLLARFFNKSSHQSTIEDGIIRLLVGNQFYDIEVSAKRVHHHKESAWLCYLKNVTELLKTQRSLSEERELLRKVLDSIPEQIYFKSTKDKIIGCNDAWAKANKTTVSKATGLKQSEIQSKEQIQRAHEQESSVWSGEVFNTQEWIQQNNQLALMNITKVPLYNDKDSVFAILSVASDVTTIHNLNKQLKDESLQRKQTEKALSKQVTLLKSIFEAAQDPIGLIDEKGVVLGANRSFSHFMGTEQQDIEGTSQKQLLPYERADWSERQNREVLDQDKAITFEELVFFKEKETWYEVHKTPFKDEQSDSKGIVVLARDITERKEKEVKLSNEASEFEQQSLSDQLTNIANRRSFDEKINHEWQSAIKEGSPITLVMCDIDFFKPYNDTYGHQKGDETLKQVASIMHNLCEQHNCFVARYGGEEFVLLITEKSATQALRVAEEIRQAVEDAHIEHPKSLASSFVTVSMGMATHIPDEGTNSKGLLKEADKALYEAKSTGRNQVQVA